MKKNLNDQRQVILKLLAEKAVMKQNVFANTINIFEQIRDSSQNVVNELASEIRGVDSHLPGQARYAEAGRNPHGFRQGQPGTMGRRRAAWSGDV